MDYQVYSVVIEDYLERTARHHDNQTRVLIFSQLVTRKNWTEWYGKSMYEFEDDIYSILLYDTVAIKLVRNPMIKEGLLKLEEQFFNTPYLDETKFDSKLNVTTTSRDRFDKYFKSIFGGNSTLRTVNRGWKRFYRKNPDVFGIYGLSKIIYVDKYALFYIEHSAGGLFGSGDIVILQKSNEGWKILKFLNIWMT